MKISIKSINKEYLSGIVNPLVQLPNQRDSHTHVWHLFVLLSHYRTVLQTWLHTQGIKSHIHYPVGHHQQQAYADMDYLHLPIVEQLQHEVLSLPLNPLLTDLEMQTVINACTAFQAKAQELV